MGVLRYNPPPTLKRFMLSDKRIRFVRGPVGSGKSTAMAMELLRRARQQAPSPDGIRRSRAAIIRNTHSQLTSTCLETIRQLLRPVMHYKVSQSKIEIRMEGLESDWLLLPLDTTENVQRLLSLELTFAWISEAREIDPSIAMDVYSRTGRYPSKLDGNTPVTWRGLIMESNSFSEDSPWYSQLELELKDGWGYFVQPGAFEDGAENLENLPKRYYEDMIELNTPEWCDQYVHNKITPSLSGQAVFRSSFDHAFHVSTEPLRPIPGSTLIIGMDFGRHPAALLCQIDPRGRFMVLAELEQENIGVEQFVTTQVRPMLHSERFLNMSAFISGDPSGMARGEVGEESVFAALKRLGFVAVPASTNHITPRIRAVERFLLQHAGGQAGFVIDGVNCPKLVMAMKSKYRYKKKKNGEIEDKPDKKRPWADLADALQYACLGAGSNTLGRVMRQMTPKTRESAPSAAGWT